MSLPSLGFILPLFVKMFYISKCNQTDSSGFSTPDPVSKIGFGLLKKITSNPSATKSHPSSPSPNRSTRDTSSPHRRGSYGKAPPTKAARRKSANDKDKPSASSNQDLGRSRVRSQSQPCTKPRKTWDTDDPHERSRSLLTDLTRLAQPKNPLAPVQVS